LPCESPQYLRNQKKQETDNTLTGRREKGKENEERGEVEKENAERGTGQVETCGKTETRDNRNERPDTTDNP
jgi:hypothetical protein